MIWVYMLTLRQCTGRARLAILALLSAMPVMIAMQAVASSRAPTVAQFEAGVIGGMFAGVIVPLVALAIASAAFANEIEDRTLANLALSPIPRWRIVVPKLLAAVTVSGSFVLVSAFFTSQIAFNHDDVATLAITASGLAGVLLYSSVFLWVGLVTTRAIGVGLVYVMLWEGFFSQWVTGIRFLSIRHYAIALMHGLDARRFAAVENLSFPVAVGTAVVVFCGFLWLAIRRLRRMDVP
jgi:ABC-2 type transport system permease protein